MTPSTASPKPACRRASAHAAESRERRESSHLRNQALNLGRNQPQQSFVASSVVTDGTPVTG